MGFNSGFKELSTFLWLLVLKVLKQVACCATEYTEFEAEMGFRSSHIEHVLTD